MTHDNMGITAVACPTATGGVKAGSIPVMSTNSIRAGSEVVKRGGLYYVKVTH